jgi:hypothetical protein
LQIQHPRATQLHRTLIHKGGLWRLFFQGRRKFNQRLRLDLFKVPFFSLGLLELGLQFFRAADLKKFFLLDV